MKLVFGDNKSIKYRDNYIKNEIVRGLSKKVKCPYCKASAKYCFEVDVYAKEVGWVFECEPNCPNSVEYGEQHGFDSAIVWTDLNGKFIEERRIK